MVDLGDDGGYTSVRANARVCTLFEKDGQSSAAMDCIGTVIPRCNPHRRDHTEAIQEHSICEFDDKRSPATCKNEPQHASK